MAFSPVFQRPFSATFDRRAAAAAALPWWLAGGAPTPVAVYQPKGAASLAASYVNLANPGTYDAAPGTAPTFDAATGWTFNGTNQYLTTGVVPNGGAYTCVVRFSDSSGNNAFFGTQSSSTTIFAIFRNTANGLYYNNGGASTAKHPVINQGVVAVAGSNTGYRNGVAESGTVNQAWSGTLTHALYIGARNNAGTTDQYFNGKIQAIVIYNMTLTAPQVAAVSAAMAAL